MHKAGFLTGLLCERHPLVALACFLLIVPPLFLAGDVHAHAVPGGTGAVICTEDGFRVVGRSMPRDAPPAHNLQCLGVCIQGVSPGALPSATATAPLRAGLPVEATVPADERAELSRRCLNDRIRAPPSPIV